jgi:hypothetical protein
MPVIVPEPTPKDIVESIAALAEAELTGIKVLSGGEYLRENTQVAKRLSRAGTKLRGVIIQWVRMVEEEADELGANLVTHYVSIRVFEEYRIDPDGLGDPARFFVMDTIWRIAAVLRNNRDLDFGSDVTHKFLQIPQDIAMETDETLGSFYLAEASIAVEVMTYGVGEC